MIEDGDFMLLNGSLAIDEVDEQIVEFVMVAAPGEIKEVPTLGVNVKNMLNGIIDPFFVGQLKTQLKTQHLEAKSVIVTTEEIAVEL